jgi:hypothetical protein
MPIAVEAVPMPYFVSLHGQMIAAMSNTGLDLCMSVLAELFAAASARTTHTSEGSLQNLLILDEDMHQQLLMQEEVRPIW